jgi:hypothetical protein
VGSNVAVYAAAAGGLIRAVKRRHLRITNIEEAFAILEKSLEASYPELPEGFTWSEVVTRLKSSSINLDWSDVERTLRQYEAYRYGGIAYRDVSVAAVLELAMKLPKGDLFVTGSQE